MIRIEDLKKRYVDFELNCSLEVQAGCITGLIGQNGAGKSTTFKAIMDLVHADAGSIEIFGKSHKKLSVEDKQKIGVVWSGSGFQPVFTIKQIIPILASMYPAFDKKSFLEKCERFQLPLDKKLKEFSTGMQAKLRVLIATSYGASLLLLDEPTAGLDVVAREKVLEMLREYMEEDENRAILISSHISSDLEGLCDDIYMIHEGNIVLHEETDVILSDYAILKVDTQQYETLDKQYVLRTKKEMFGYCCLTNQRQYYQENYPDIVIEKGTIDDLILMMIGGEK